MRRERNISKPGGIESRMGIGILLVLVGITLIAVNMGLIPWFIKEVLISWQMLLIVIGTFSLLSSSHKISGIIMISLGGFFLLPELFHFPFPFRRLFWPAVFIALGLIIIFRRKSTAAWDDLTASEMNSTEFMEDTNIFGGGEKIVNSDNFKGGRITSIFGGSSYNMLNTKLSEGHAVIDVMNIFGGSKFIITPDWNVKIEALGIFGGFNDRRAKIPHLEIDSDKEFIIRGITIFGGGEIKTVL